MPQQYGDLSQATHDNPTKWLHQNYQTIMQQVAADPEGTMRHLMELFKGIVGHGFSELNYRKFCARMQDAMRKYGTAGVQKYLSDFMLKGIDPRLGVVGTRECSEIEALSTVLMEDVCDSTLPEEVTSLMPIMQQFGLRVVSEASGGWAQLNGPCNR